MTVLYCDCFSGISGDMFLSALIDAGLPLDHLVSQLNLLNLPEFEGAAAIKVHKGALAATLLTFEIHNHSGESEHGSHHHDHHRHYSDIRGLIESSGLAESIKSTSLRIFQKLAEAEAGVHGTSIDEVHFHEVGAVDSILDIVGAAVGLTYFDVQAVYSSALPLGSGQVNTQHGMLPLPAPATLALIQMVNAPVRASSATVELVTPTGAAILAALAEFRQPDMRVRRVGMGAGQRNLEWPNILRVLVGSPEFAQETHLEMKTNIDDMNPQLLGHVMNRLFQAGALDVYFTPIFMKKNRPATRLSVILRSEDEERIADLLLRETTTLGVRVTPIRRHEAEREMRTVLTPYGEVPVKLKFWKGDLVQAVPEFDACTRLAETHKVEVLQVLNLAESIATAQYLS